MSTQMDDQARGRVAPAGEPVEQRSLGDNLRLAGGLALVAALLLFFVQNRRDEEISFLWMDWDPPLFVGLLVSAAFGSVDTWLFTTIRGRSERKRQEAMFDSAMRGAKRDR